MLYILLLLLGLVIMNMASKEAKKPSMKASVAGIVGAVIGLIYVMLGRSPLPADTLPTLNNAQWGWAGLTLIIIGVTCATVIAPMLYARYEMQSTPAVVRARTNPRRIQR